jgi:hypothetical protein
VTTLSRELTRNGWIRPKTRSGTVNKVVRSTRVPTDERFWAPVMRSPSQCPGKGDAWHDRNATSRSHPCAGRFTTRLMSWSQIGICPIRAVMTWHVISWSNDRIAR